MVEKHTEEQDLAQTTARQAVADESNDISGRTSDSNQGRSIIFTRAASQVSAISRILFSQKAASWVSALGSIVLLFLILRQIDIATFSMQEESNQFRETMQEFRHQSDIFSRILMEQQRARLSFKINVEQVEEGEETAFRIVCPIEIGGLTEGRNVRFKNYIAFDRPNQLQYLSFVDVNWAEREAHDLSDISPTETGRRFTAAPLTQQQLSRIVSPDESLYFVARMEYCDIYGACRYFMRCAEVGKRFSLVTYCGTVIGDLIDETEGREP